MAQVYFAKFNINSDIYEVYAKQNSIEELLKKIVLSLSTDKTIIISDDAGVQDKIKFVDLDNQYEKGFVFGRIARIGTKEQEEYVPSMDTVKTTIKDNLASTASFYFDLNTEIIAFITRTDIGYKQFINYFKMLVEECLPDIEVELFLEHNIDELTAQLKSFKFVSKVMVTLVPPNPSNDEDMNDLFGCSAQDMKDAGITKLVQTATGSLKRNVKKGINVGSNWFSRIIKFGVGRGYGTISVEGQDAMGVRRSITSDEQALFKRSISDDLKHSMDTFREVARSGIIELKLQKKRMTEDERKEE